VDIVEDDEDASFKDSWLQLRRQEELFYDTSSNTFL
jgi:hypothetical protein